MTDIAYGKVESAQPVLVSGVYRSGTTFLAAVLGAHFSLYSASNTVKFIRFCLGRYGSMSSKSNRQKLVEDTAKRLMVRWGIRVDSEAVLRAAETEDEPTYALLYDLLMRAMLKGDVTKSIRWVEKVNLMWSGIPYFLDMFPNGRVVQIVRDPRDVTASYKSMTFERGLTYLDTAFNWLDAMETIASLDEKYSDRVFVIRAEDLAEYPDSAVTQLQKFLGLQADGNMLNVDRLFSVGGVGWADNTSFGEPYTCWPSAKSRWREYLGRDETIFIELITIKWMLRYGYSSSKYEPDSEEWKQIYRFLSKDKFIMERFMSWLHTGQGCEGYRTDPYIYEMKKVFPERFKDM